MSLACIYALKFNLAELDYVQTRIDHVLSLVKIFFIYIFLFSRVEILDL